MDIKELLDQFTLFDSAKGQRAELPAVISNIQKSLCTEWIIVCCIQV